MATLDPTGERTFQRHRPVLGGIAYQILGSVFDAEDVVQDAWLRWSATDRSQVADPKAFLVTVTTRLAIDRLRRARGRRVTYVGTWLPEPAEDGVPVALISLVAAADQVHEIYLLANPEKLGAVSRNRTDAASGSACRHQSPSSAAAWPG